MPTSPPSLAAAAAEHTAAQKVADYTRSSKRGNKIGRAKLPLLKHPSDDQPFYNDFPENSTDADREQLLSKGNCPGLLFRHVPSLLQNNSAYDQQRDLVLHPINLNSKLYEIVPSHGSVSKGYSKSPHQQNNDSFSMALIDHEGGKQERSTGEGQVTSIFNAPEECSTSFSTAASKSTEKEELILWRNAVFCSEAWELTCETGSSLRSSQVGKTCKDQDDVYSHQSQDKVGKPDRQNHHILTIKHTTAAVSLSPDTGKPDRFSIDTTASAVAGSSPLFLSSDGHSTGGYDEQAKRQSSLGSSVSVCDTSTIKKPQLHVLKDLPKSPLLEELKLFMQNCKDATSLEYKKQSKPVKATSLEYKKQDQPVRESATALTSSSLNAKPCEEQFVASDDEARIRAELEVEIERDLEREIKTKISLLNRRLDELHSLQARRYYKEEDNLHTSTINTPGTTPGKAVVGTVTGSEADGITSAVTRVSLPKSTEAPRHRPPTPRGRNMHAVEGRMAQASKKLVYPCPTSVKAQPPSPTPVHTDQKGAHFSYDKSPVICWKKLAAAPGTPWPGMATGTKETTSTLPHVRTSSLPKHATEGSNKASSKPKILTDSKTEASPSIKIDWIRTLRAGSAGPKVPSSKLDAILHGSVDRTTVTLSASVQQDCPPGKVVRTLFCDLSTPGKSTSKACTTEEKKDRSSVTVKEFPVLPGSNGRAAVAGPSSSARTGSIGSLQKPKTDQKSAPKAKAISAAVQKYQDPDLVNKRAEIRSSKTTQDKPPVGKLALSLDKLDKQPLAGRMTTSSTAGTAKLKEVRPKTLQPAVKQGGATPTRAKLKEVRPKTLEPAVKQGGATPTRAKLSSQISGRKRDAGLVMKAVRSK